MPQCRRQTRLWPELSPDSSAITGRRIYVSVAPSCPHLQHHKLEWDKVIQQKQLHTIIPKLFIRLDRIQHIQHVSFQVN